MLRFIGIELQNSLLFCMQCDTDRSKQPPSSFVSSEGRFSFGKNAVGLVRILNAKTNEDSTTVMGYQSRRPGRTIFTEVRRIASPNRLRSQPSHGLSHIAYRLDARLRLRNAACHNVPRYKKTWLLVGECPVCAHAILCWLRRPCVRWTPGKSGKKTAALLRNLIVFQRSQFVERWAASSVWVKNRPYVKGSLHY
ncbi:hypothetical protein BS50DRAFT_319596 [Corynespora cassiicola Philippines]|uniref:Uncharacterized protein n=1 Tax=Corynespora cassiicola Philippines TaxID=1448308 RepID=A0A2T2NT16_CORCC|nr:hypothetical protein BS50DRAFT_319596 [Corynespora cassiicola Philippines]